MRSGKPRERKTREMPSRPACGLVASWRGRSSRTKGVLCSKGKRAAMKRYIEYLYYIVNKKDANYSTFFENPKIRRGSGSVLAQRDIGGGLECDLGEAEVAKGSV